MVGPNDRYNYEGDPEGERAILRSIDPELPTLFLDVDGVVNALARNSPHVWDDASISYASPAFTGDREWPIYTSPHIGPALMRLGVNVVWLTTWKYDANPQISPLVDLPTDLPVGDAPRRLSNFQGWKTEVVMEHLETTTQATVWIDDEAIPPGFDEWGRKEFLDKRILTVIPDPHVGITPREVELIDYWLKEGTS